METVFVAMSGGMDSSFSAYLLKQKGYRVVGVTFSLLPKGWVNTRNPKACCSVETMNRARKAADDLSIPHYVINLREEFEEHVIAKFVSEYRSGRTPNPCVLCNQHIKFSIFAQKAFALGAESIATGHYASIDRTHTGCVLKKGKDASKDQSYFLYPIRYDQLSFILFPLSDWTKKAVRRAMAGQAGSADTMQESQDICFIPEKDYRSFVARYVPLKRGDIFLVDGKHLGYHEGVHLYTVGQRRGLNIPFTEPLYVTEIKVDENVLIVGPQKYLQRRILLADNVNMLSGRLSGTALGKVRYRQTEQPCSYNLRDGRLEVTFDAPISAITPGQSVVLYEKDMVLGGGTILQAS